MNPSDEPWLAWCDGTASPNPGRIGLGVVLVGVVYRMARRAISPAA